MEPKVRLNDLHLTGRVGHTEGLLEPAEGHPRSLLVVDDDPDVQDLLEQVLSGAGYLVETAGSSTEAMEKIAEGGHHGMVLDLVLPEDEDGLALYERILDVNPYLRGRVVFISGVAREHQIKRIHRVVGGSFLPKPFNILDLLKVLQDLGL